MNKNPIIIGETRHVASHMCGKCGAKLDAATPIGNNRMPKPGDATVCGYCGVFLIFGEALNTREMTAEEILALPENARILMTHLSRFAISGILQKASMGKK